MTASLVLVAAIAPGSGLAVTPDRLLLNSCAIVLQGSGESVLRKRIADGEGGFEIDVYRKYVALSRRSPSLQRFLPTGEVTELLADSEQIIFHQTIGAFLDEVEAGKLGRFTDDQVRESFERILNLRVPKATIPDRLTSLKSLEILADFGSRLSAIRHAFGELNLKELQTLVHGGDPLKPTADSLVGLYLAETQASTVVRTFARAPNEGDQGPQRLVVALSEQTLDAYRKYFVRPEFLAHVHYPQQGTLFLAHNGKVGTYAAMNAELRFPQLGSVLPHLLLKSSEAQRANQFFELGSVYDDIARHPWSLPGYCATGGYNSCTHWVGNIPVGDEAVETYKFPGRVDMYAGNNVGAEPQIRALAPYEFRAGIYGGSARDVERLNNLARRVWKAPGHMQLAELLGPAELEASLRGEYANPGYVAYRLLGNVTSDRMPVVFFAVPDHRTPLSENFDSRINAY